MNIRTLLVSIHLPTLVLYVQGSEKKGVVHWAPSYMCDDFKVLDNMTWWFDFRMHLDYFHKHDICTSTIDNYKTTHVPMVWEYRPTTIIRIADEAQYILGFNEPNHKNQSRMTPQRAADAWPDMETNSKGKPLVSPSAAVCGSDCISDEIAWFDEFFKLCNGCRVDYLATHTYWCNATKVMTYLENLYTKYGRKIWLTEFACSKTSDPTVQLDFMKEILPQLEAADFIFRYSWYAARLTKSGFVKTSASLLEIDQSVLTTLGQYYNDFQGQPDPSKVGRKETMLILQSFSSNPTPWWKIFRYMKKNENKLPNSVKALYKSASKKQLKRRISETFNEILCTDLEQIQDEDIRDMVEDIKRMPEETKTGKKKGRYLRVLPC